MVCLCLTASINRLKVKCLKFRSSVLALRSDTIVIELLKEITATSCFRYANQQFRQFQVNQLKLLE